MRTVSNISEVSGHSAINLSKLLQQFLWVKAGYGLPHMNITQISQHCRYLEDYKESVMAITVIIPT